MEIVLSSLRLTLAYTLNNRSFLENNRVDAHIELANSSLVKIQARHARLQAALEEATVELEDASAEPAGEASDSGDPPAGRRAARLAARASGRASRLTRMGERAVKVAEDRVARSAKRVSRAQERIASLELRKTSTRSTARSFAGGILPFYLLSEEVPIDPPVENYLSMSDPRVSRKDNRDGTTTFTINGETIPEYGFTLSKAGPELEFMLGPRVDLVSWGIGTRACYIHSGGAQFEDEFFQGWLPRDKSHPKMKPGTFLAQCFCNSIDLPTKRVKNVEHWDVTNVTDEEFSQFMVGVGSNTGVTEEVLDLSGWVFSMFDHPEVYFVEGFWNCRFRKLNISGWKIENTGNVNMVEFMGRDSSFGIVEVDASRLVVDAGGNVILEDVMIVYDADLGDEDVKFKLASAEFDAGGSIAIDNLLSLRNVATGGIIAVDLSSAKLKVAGDSGIEVTRLVDAGDPTDPSSAGGIAVDLGNSSWTSIYTGGSVQFDGLAYGRNFSSLNTVSVNASGAQFWSGTESVEFSDIICLRNCAGEMDTATINFSNARLIAQKYVILDNLLDVDEELGLLDTAKVDFSNANIECLHGIEMSDLISSDATVTKHTMVDLNGWSASSNLSLDMDGLASARNVESATTIFDNSLIKANEFSLHTVFESQGVSGDPAPAASILSVSEASWTLTGSNSVLDVWSLFTGFDVGTQILLTVLPSSTKLYAVSRRDWHCFFSASCRQIGRALRRRHRL